MKASSSAVEKTERGRHGRVYGEYEDKTLFGATRERIALSVLPTVGRVISRGKIDDRPFR